MIEKKISGKIFLYVLIFLMNGIYAQSLTYYVDSQKGSDTNDGLTENAPWQSLDFINTKTFKPGDQILFKCGSAWNGTLSPKGSGAAGKPIVIGKYGSGINPILNGNGLVTQVISLFNQEYWTIGDLEITNSSGTADQITRRGIYIKATDYGVVHNIRLTNLYIHDINSYIDPNSDTNKNYGGIFFEVTGTSKVTYFDNFIIENCTLLNIDRTGISNNSSWSNRTLTINTNWYPSTNILIRNNIFDSIGANGLIVRVADKPLIEKNVFKKCGLNASGNALFPFNCDDATIQYNEVYQTVYNPGDNDASGIDADYRCKRTLIQYNYSHDNDDGFVVITCQGGSDRFNDGTIVRYNISQNDGGKGSTSGAIVYLSGTTTNTSIYNNTIYSSISNSIRRIVYHNSWSGYPDKTSYYNNIFCVLKTPTSSSFSTSSSTNNTFDYNLYFGSLTSPFDSHKISADPKLMQPGSAYEGIASVTGYMLQPASPCIDAGINLSNNGGKDFWNYSVPGNNKTDIGAHEFNGLPTSRVSEKEMPNGFTLEQNYPNPFNPSTTIKYQIPQNDALNAVYVRVLLKVFDPLGREIATLVDELKPPGVYSCVFNTKMAGSSFLSSGIYFYQLTAGKFTQTKKMLLIQ